MHKPMGYRDWRGVPHVLPAFAVLFHSNDIGISDVPMGFQFLVRNP